MENTPPISRLRTASFMMPEVVNMTPNNQVDYKKLEEQLEQQELEAAGGVASAQIYGQLLGIYLLHNDLTNAKFLWKRIPQAIKSANPELALIWTVGQKLWLRDFPAIYESLNKDWSEPVKPIMGSIFEATKNRAFYLVAQAYSFISADDLSAFVGLPVTEAIEAVRAQGWQADPQTRMIIPKKPGLPADPSIPSGQQLARLTDFVSFLEI